MPGIQRSASCNAVGYHFRLAAFVHHRANVRTGSARPNLESVSSQGDAAKAAEEMYGAIERRVVIMIIQGRNHFHAHHETSYFWNDTTQRTLPTQLKRSHELFNEHSPR